jgi:hypothetical protein
MATVNELIAAGVKAHESGDDEAAAFFAGEIKKARAAQSRPVQINNASESGLENFRAGVGKTFVDVASGIGQLGRHGLENIGGKKLADALGLDTDQEITERRGLDADLMRTKAGLGGNIAGSVALFAPTAFIPGANTVTGGALLGAGLGALSPVAQGESRLANAGMGAAGGALFPAIGRTFKTARAAIVDPMSRGGTARIVGAKLNKMVSGGAAQGLTNVTRSERKRIIGERTAQTLQNIKDAKGATAGFNPSTAQAAQSYGISSLDRAMRSKFPQGYEDLNKSQSLALGDALKNIAKTPEDRLLAEQARSAATSPLYAQSGSTVVPSDTVLNELLKRPSMGQALGRAVNLSAEKGRPISIPRDVPAVPATQVPSSILDAAGNPVMTQIPARAAIPAQYSGDLLQTIKMGLDDAIGSPMQGMQGAERNAALGTKGELLNWIGQKIPAHAAANQAYIDMSKPISQMDIGQTFYNRLFPAITDQANGGFRTTANSYANALRQGDQIAQNETGFAGAKLANIMTPDQMGVLQGVGRDASVVAESQAAGAAAGSPTYQNMVMGNIADQIGIPNWMAKIGTAPAGWMGRAAGAIYGGADDRLQQALADALIDPQVAHAAMVRAANAATPSRLGQALQGTALATTPFFNNSQQPQ